jgi:hypothetical protein
MLKKIFFASSLIFLSSSLVKVHAQQAIFPTSLNKVELFHNDVAIGFIDTVVISGMFEKVEDKGFQPEYTAIHTPIIYVIFADSVPKRKIKAALNKILPWGTTYILEKGPYQARETKQTERIQPSNKFLIRAGQKRIAALITGIAGAGTTAGFIALKEPLAGGLLGEAVGLLALFLEFSSASDLIKAGNIETAK